MSDLDRLIEAVEAGDVWLNQYHLLGRSRASDARKAYHGSLDAAKRLHDALLPGWSVEIVGPTTDDEWIVNLPEQDSAFASDPARAWLLAILRAVKAQAQL